MRVQITRVIKKSLRITNLTLYELKDHILLLMQRVSQGDCNCD